MDGLQAYAISKKLAASIVAGVDSMSVDGLTLHIECTDGTNLSMNFPTPTNGVSVEGVTVNEDKHLIVTLSDNTTIDAGLVPTVKGEQGEQGEQGIDGVSPIIIEDANNTDTVYKLKITDVNGTITTPNLKGIGGSGEGASTWSELLSKPFATIGTAGLKITDNSLDVDFTKVQSVLDDASATTSGKMSATDKTKLDTIENEAQKNIIETVKVNGVANTVSNKSVDITVPENLSDLTNDGNFVSDDNYVHTDNNYTTDEKQKVGNIGDFSTITITSVTDLVGALNKLNASLLGGLAYSDKKISILDKNMVVKQELDVSSIITDTSVGDLKDIILSEVTNGDALVFNSVTNKFENKAISASDEKVKMISTSTAGYLSDMIDDSTIQVVENKLVAKTLDGLTVTIANLNTLAGMTENVKSVLDSIASGGAKFKDVVDTYASLPTENVLNGDMYIVAADETDEGHRNTYIYSTDHSQFALIGTSDIEIRNFTTNPINLTNEVTGVLPQSNIDLTGIAKTADLDAYTNTTDLENEYAKKTDLTVKVNTADIVDNLLSESADKVLSANQGKVLESEISTLSGNVNNHVENKTNPHEVTKEQIGLGNVPNVTTNDQTPTFTESASVTALTNGEKLSSLFGKIAKSISSLISHLANKENPHGVTKSQVGLGSVDNTSDADKPVSTAQASAINAVADNLGAEVTRATAAENALNNNLATCFKRLSNINSTTDLNSLLEVGRYAFGGTSTPTNKPADSPDNNGFVDVINYSVNNDNISQTYSCVISGVIYTWQRRYYTGTWGDWHKLINDIDFANKIKGTQIIQYVNISDINGYTTSIATLQLFDLLPTNCMAIISAATNTQITDLPKAYMYMIIYKSASVHYRHMIAFENNSIISEHAGSIYRYVATSSNEGKWFELYDSRKITSLEERVTALETK